MRFRGRFIELRKRKTKSSGKRLCTFSGASTRIPTASPIEPKASEIAMESATRTRAPANPASMCAPAINPTAMYVLAWKRPSASVPAS